MSENTIPQNNLPIYLQEYTVSVLGNLTSLDCTVAPEDEVGTIQYSTLGVIPSNKKDARVWDLKASGTLKPHDKDYIIHYDLSKVDYKGEVTFESPLSGVITVCGRVISISKKNATWFPCEETKTVSIIIDQSRWGFSIIKETPFSIDIQLDDDDALPDTPIIPPVVPDPNPGEPVLDPNNPGPTRTPGPIPSSSPRPRYSCCPPPSGACVLALPGEIKEKCENGEYADPFIEECITCSETQYE